MDLLKNVPVTGVVTQGRPRHDNQWVTSYQIKYLKDGQNDFVTVEDENNQPIVYFFYFNTIFFTIFNL